MVYWSGGVTDRRGVDFRKHFLKYLTFLNKLKKIMIVRGQADKTYPISYKLSYSDNSEINS